METREPPLVGREDELRALLAHLDWGGPGPVRLVAIRGDAGVGKTRLARELLRQAGSKGWKILAGKCLQAGGVPYGALAEALASGGLEHLMDFGRPPRLDHVFLMEPEGRLFAKAQRAGTGLDADVFAGMLAAVTIFIRESLTRLNPSTAPTSQLSMGYGRHRILIEARPWAHLVVVLTGQETETLREAMADRMEEVGARDSQLLARWNGDQQSVAQIRQDLEQLLQDRRFAGTDTVSEPEDRRWRLLLSVERGLQRAAAATPLLLFLDDLHWADAGTAALLRHLLHRAAKPALLLLATLRDPPGGGADAATGDSLLREGLDQGWAQTITLGPLPTAQLRDLLGGSIGDLAKGPAGDSIVEASAGNPLLALELVALLRADGTIVREGGAERLARPLARGAIPARLRDSVVTRLGQMARDEREATEFAAVLDERVRPELLACTLRWTALDVHRVLRAVAHRPGMVRAVEGGGWYRFDHPSVREALASEVPESMRLEVHRAAVDCLVGQRSRSRDRDSDPTLAELVEIALHAEEGRHPDAISHLRAAGDAARLEFEHDTARRFYEAAIRLTDQEEPQLLQHLAEVEFHAGRSEVAVALAERARRATPAKGDRVGLVARMARPLERLGLLAKAVAVLHSEPPDVGTPAEATAVWHAARGWIRFRQLDYNGAQEDATMALDLLHAGPGRADDLADAWNTLGCINTMRGRLETAADQLRRGAEIATEGGARYQAVRCKTNLALTMIQQGALTAARDLALATGHEAEESGNLYFVGHAGLQAGMADLQQGEPARALIRLARAERVLESIDARAMLGECRAILAECTAAIGAWEEALPAARSAVALATTGSRYEATSRTSLAAVLLGAGKPEEAAVEAQAALRILGQTGDRAGSTNALGLLGSALALTGQRAEAESSFAAGLEIAADAPPIARGRLLRLWAERLVDWGETGQAKAALAQARGILAPLGPTAERTAVERIADRLRPEGDEAPPRGG